MHRYQVLSLEQSDIWKQYLSALPREQQDVYFTPEYLQLYEERGGGKAHCFVFEKDGDIALYPFLMNRINDLGYDLDQDYYDIQGAYGYNGIATNAREKTFFDQFALAWLDWLKDEKVVAEFIRYNPVLQNENFCSWAPPIDVLDNVLIPLTDYEHIWKHSYDPGVRNAVRKANKHGMSFTIQIGEEITAGIYAVFTKLYIQTMQRRNADDFFYFEPEYFERLLQFLKSHLILVAASYEDKVISADLYLHNNINAYGFLSGTLSEYFKISPSTFLRDQTIQALIERGFKNYSIGGGLARNDSIYKYKKSFSTSTDSLFYIGRCIHNHNVYQTIEVQWRQRVGSGYQKYDQLLLKYRNGLHSGC